MARIRSIKPEFWTSEQILECSTNARLLFIGIWNFCDDAGRHPFSAKQCKAEVFPADGFSESDVLGMLNELSKNGLITRYVSGGKEYFFVNGWKHQRIDKPQEPKYPDPEAEHSEIIPGILPPDRIGKDRKGKDRKGKDRIDSRSVAVATRPANEAFENFKKTYPKRKGSNPWKPAEKQFRAALAQGATPEEIISALHSGIGYDRDKIGTEYIPQAVKWLRDRRWEDQPNADQPQGPAIPNDFAVKLFRDNGRWNSLYGPEPGKPGCRATAELLEKYGFMNPEAA